jgi:hypothetical protein
VVTQEACVCVQACSDFLQGKPSKVANAKCGPTGTLKTILEVMPDHVSGVV